MPLNTDLTCDKKQFNNKVTYRHFHFALFISSITLFGLPACSTLPKKTPLSPEYVYDTDTDQTSLAQIIEPLKAQHPELTGYHVLYDPFKAFAARIQLIDRAEKTLDLQYYIWDNDKIGALALYKIIQAADRGVKVRLLIDDNNAQSMEAVYLALDQHANIQVRLFNPYRFRQLRPIDMVLDLKRINRRMHNKTFTADHQVSLIGGRNMSDHYYNLSDSYQFSDVDVMLVGQAVEDIGDSFDQYWNDSYSYPVLSIVNPNQNTLRYEGLKQQLIQNYQQESVQNYLNISNRSNDFNHWLEQHDEWEWVKAEVVKDSPDKIRAKAKKEQQLNFQLHNRLNAPNQDIDLISAYFVPEKSGTERIGQLSQDGVHVRILTNSFKANDVSLVHAFYAKYRMDLLKSGVELYEFLPALSDEQLTETTKDLSKQAKINLKGLSRSSLHAKLMSVDNKQVFIGSFNIDPRSAYLNTEIGVILDSPPLATMVHETIDQHINRYAYKLVLDDQGKITWQLQTNNATLIYNKEPRIKWWQKAGLKIISWLPLEGFM
ncbi:phospholipase D family protein [Acinetobacter rudis]|uniref:Phospholipase D family protein n=1 Tax=Acinetobacter rudis TaxID=632955 RepID=A0AAW8JB60_9GAMM|nr:phospholipase D family protein [Acinetobacter rudis]MDQ8936182.1 phospholipase D family protein [Acinetobacter rudis]MDQ9018460.1 phospholipase D family protein [Acinetobacter rudis]